MRNEGPSQWSPFLDGNQAAAARGLAEEIAEGLPDPYQLGATDLADGCGGTAVLHHYLARTSLLPDASRERAARHLACARAGAPELPIQGGLYHGAVGVGWATSHCNPEAAAESLVAVHDEDLQALSDRGHFDLISGLVGFGVYALERLPEPAAWELLEAVVGRLLELVEEDDHGYWWRTRPDVGSRDMRATSPDGYYDVGVAHGTPGVIGLLAGATRVGAGPSELPTVIERAASWLFAFPRRESYPLPWRGWLSGRGGLAPLGWCYGDLGIAAVLMTAGQAIDSDYLCRNAATLARRAAGRVEAQSAIDSAIICHGAAGAVLMFGRLHQATGERVLIEAAREWLDRLLAMRRPGCPAARSFMVEKPDGPWAEPGFLQGAAGIALVLLAASTDVAPDWDRALLLSYR